MPSIQPWWRRPDTENAAATEALDALDQAAVDGQEALDGASADEVGDVIRNLFQSALDLTTTATTALRSAIDSGDAQTVTDAMDDVQTASDAIGDSWMRPPTSSARRRSRRPARPWPRQRSSRRQSPRLSQHRNPPWSQRRADGGADGTHCGADGGAHRTAHCHADRGTHGPADA